MNWKQLLTTKRLGQEDYISHRIDARTQFQMDYDRLIFSSPFRRLQHKTQVFPLPSGIFVHNRLTHSLEVASVGRSLGNMVASGLKNKGNEEPLLQEIGSIVSAACLAHDLGNPPFGHSGEDAISNYFRSQEREILKTQVKTEEWEDLKWFEGNANALRLLTHSFNGYRKGGYAMTYSTLASIVKYPYDSSQRGDKKKYGFFQSEKTIYEKIANELGLIKSDGTFMRHPLVYLVEAADDICYQVMDVEDAYRLKLFSASETITLFRKYFEGNEKAQQSICKVFNMVTDESERIAYLRSKVIGKLVEECKTVFIENQDKIMTGNFHSSLIKSTPTNTAQTYNEIAKISFEQIYKHPMVVEIEVSAYKIIETLLDKLVKAILNPSNSYAKSILRLIPSEYRVAEESSNYDKIRSVLDFVAGMTDDYALNMYRTFEGVQLPYAKRVY
ncbi:deoxyguanosinetriphosphate triphosphohydrolase [Balneicella halophila]|nr:deoxyguanosinetriphosphate triphosphohydrolase [Balneicella halophila]